MMYIILFLLFILIIVQEFRIRELQDDLQFLQHSLEILAEACEKNLRISKDLNKAFVDELINRKEFAEKLNEMIKSTKEKQDK